MSVYPAHAPARTGLKKVRLRLVGDRSAIECCLTGLPTTVADFAVLLQQLAKEAELAQAVSALLEAIVRQPLVRCSLLDGYHERHRNIAPLRRGVFDLAVGAMNTANIRYLEISPGGVSHLTTELSRLIGLNELVLRDLAATKERQLRPTELEEYILTARNPPRKVTYYYLRNDHTSYSVIDTRTVKGAAKRSGAKLRIRSVV